MPITFVGGGSSGSSASTVFPIPAVEAGDLILAHSIRTSSTAAIGAPEGFEVLREISASSKVFYKFADAAADATNSPSISSAQRHVCVVYRGVDPITPFGDAQYFGKAYASSLALNSFSASTPPADEFVFMLPSNNTPLLLSAADMSGFTQRASNVGGEAYSWPGPTFPGRTLALTSGGSIISTATFIGLIAAGGTSERQRSRLILTPW